MKVRRRRGVATEPYAQTSGIRVRDKDDGFEVEGEAGPEFIQNDRECLG